MGIFIFTADATFHHAAVKVMDKQTYLSVICHIIAVGAQINSVFVLDGGFDLNTVCGGVILNVTCVLLPHNRNAIAFLSTTTTSKYCRSENHSNEGRNKFPTTTYTV